jgi:FKBP-type peptidyl-prolyl cis-trans isomerase FklB
MKRIVIIVLCLLLPLSLVAEDNQSSPDSQADASYALGMIIGGNLLSNGLTIDLDGFMAGLKDSIGGGATKLTPAQAQVAAQSAFVAARAKKDAANLAAGKAFLESNGKKQGVTVTASGLQYEIVALGTGPRPLASDTVTVNYEGKLLDGKVFDSSIARNEPVTFPLNGVIPGWTEGLQLMPVGSKFRFYIPSDLAYGEQGAGDDIEPNSVLIFDVELISIGAQKD